MNIEDIKVYRINGKVVWTEGESIEELKKLIDVPPTTIAHTTTHTQIPSVVAQPKVEVKAEQPKVGQSGTKLERAKELYKANAEKSRKEIIELFVKELNMTPAGASTYHAQCKKSLS